jgi:tryptophan synthase beta chain
MIYVREGNIPKKWYNIVPDLPYFPPYKLPNGEEVREEHLYRIFPRECVRQEFSKERYIDIPEDLMEAYERIGRPTPLYRAIRLEKALKTPARIYYKREDLSPTGSHKTNTAIAQAYYAMKEEVKRLTTETGAGQWGSALAYSTAMMGIKALIFMVRVSYNQKPYRKYVMKMYGADVVPSPSELTEFGRRLLKENPDHPGSLGVAISEALEAALSDENTKYSLGSVLNHVLIHQSIIGQEAMEQLSSIGEKPDVLVGCVGGGSNFAGLTYPFIGEMLRKECEKWM